MSLVKSNVCSHGTIKISPLTAKLSRDTEIFGKMSPYFIIIFNKKKDISQPHKNSGKYPSWKQSFEYFKTNEESIEIEVWDKDLITNDDLIGSTSISLFDLFEKKKTEEWYVLSYKGTNAGSIFVHMDFTQIEQNTPTNKSQSMQKLPIIPDPVTNGTNQQNQNSNTQPLQFQSKQNLPLSNTNIQNTGIPTNIPSNNQGQSDQESELEKKIRANKQFFQRQFSQLAQQYTQQQQQQIQDNQQVYQQPVMNGNNNFPMNQNMPNNNPNFNQNNMQNVPQYSEDKLAYQNYFKQLAGQENSQQPLINYQQQQFNNNMVNQNPMNPNPMNVNTLTQNPLDQNPMMNQVPMNQNPIVQNPMNIHPMHANTLNQTPLIQNPINMNPLGAQTLPQNLNPLSNPQQQNFQPNQQSQQPINFLNRFAQMQAQQVGFQQNVQNFINQQNQVQQPFNQFVPSNNMQNQPQQNQQQQFHSNYNPIPPQQQQFPGQYQGFPNNYQ